MRYLLFIILTVIAYGCNASDYGLKSSPVVVSWTPLSGSVTSPIPEMAFVKVWLKPESLVGSNNGDALTFWADSSGTGSHAYSMTGGVNNHYVTNNVVNGYAAVKFNGNTYALEVTNGPFLQSFNNIPGSTVFTVSKMRTWLGGSDMLFYIGRGAPLHSIHTYFLDGQLYEIWCGKDGVSNYQWTGPPYVPWPLAWVFTHSIADYASATATLNTNSVQAFHPTGIFTPGNTTVDASILSIGVLKANAGFDGWISELLVYNTNLTASESLQVQNYFSNKFRIWP